MSTAAIIYLSLAMITLGAKLAYHGKPREPYSFWWGLVDAGVALGLLYWGGFFGQVQQ